MRVVVVVVVDVVGVEDFFTRVFKSAKVSSLISPMRISLNIFA
jgi:hypothetical protein